MSVRVRCLSFFCQSISKAKCGFYIKVDKGCISQVLVVSSLPLSPHLTVPSPRLQYVWWATLHMCCSPVCTAGCFRSWIELPLPGFEVWSLLGPTCFQCLFSCHFTVTFNEACFFFIFFKHPDVSPNQTSVMWYHTLYLVGGPHQSLISSFFSFFSSDWIPGLEADVFAKGR